MAYDKLFFDLQKVLTTNPAFASKAEGMVKKIMAAARAGDKAAMGHEMHQLLLLCDFNATLLIPFFFPHFPDQDPMTLLTRPHAIAMMACVPNGSVTVCASRQIGKCLSGLTFLPLRTAGAETVENTTISSIFDEAKSKNLAKVSHGS